MSAGTPATGAVNGLPNKRRRASSITEADLKKPTLRDDMEYISLTSHEVGADPVPLRWGADNADDRGPVIATSLNSRNRNSIGAHSGSYCIYRALAVASGKLDPNYIPNLTNTEPVANIGPFDSWSDVSKIAVMDPYGHIITESFPSYLRKGYDIRPTIAVTQAHIDLPEFRDAMRARRLTPDGKILKATGQSIITKAAIEPVWYLPEIARRFGCTEEDLRYALFRETNMMYPELITRHDMKVFLPPIGGCTIYIWGDPDTIPNEDIPLTVRVHDECNGSDVFGSDICTCRPYLTHAMEECVKTAQAGGAGVVIYYRKEGRALGEVTKYLVYNRRKRQDEGDTAKEYFNCTQYVAGVQDTRFQALMPDALHWLGITKIDRFISMSDMKYDAIVGTGIRIVERVAIPPELVPADAQVEIVAKVYAGYNGGNAYAVDEAALQSTKGREFGYEADQAPLEGAAEACVPCEDEAGKATASG